MKWLGSSAVGEAVDVTGMSSSSDRWVDDLKRPFGQAQTGINAEGSSAVPPLSGEISFLLKYGYSIDQLQSAERRASQLGLPAAKVLLDTGQISELAYFDLMATELGLEFCPVVPSGHDILSRLPPAAEWSRMARMAWHAPQCSHTLFNAKQADFFIAPDGQQFALLRQLLRKSPQFARRIKITTHQSGLNHLINRARPALLDQARNGLRDRQPALSAERVMTVSQSFTCLLLAQLLVAIGTLSAGLFAFAFHLPALLAYFSQAGLRLSSWATMLPGKKTAIERRLADEVLPTYSVMVALYKEANQVDELVAALSRLDWPKEKLEIKLIFEDDDLETIAASHRALRRQNVPITSIVNVPKGLPRTKPRALNYALPLCSGEFLVVYDAEDRPDPGQLREAHAAFLAGPARLACLQAPLSIHNAKDGWLASLFAIEYAAHFDGLLPSLERFGLPILLGGSSNHFKRQALVNIGA